MDVILGIKNVISKSKGYSWCYNCGYTWEIVKSVTIPYTTRFPDRPKGGMFPICQQCFDLLEEKDILEYAKRLLNEWIKSAETFGEEFKNHKESLKINYNNYLDNLKYNIHYMKENKEKEVSKYEKGIEI